MIRKLRKEDVVAIEDIYSLYWPDDEFRKKLCKRLRDAANSALDSIEQGFKYLVAENDGQVVGIVGFRKVPEHMREFTITKNPAELYMLAVKNPGNGIGQLLLEKTFAELKKLNYTELVVYSGETHKRAWNFYDRNFKRVKPAIAPNSEPGYVWRALLDSK